MQRDMKLVRAILEAIAAEPTADLKSAPTFPDWTPAQVIYHLDVLEEAKYITIKTKASGGLYLGFRLTWAGHEALDAMRRVGTS